MELDRSRVLVMSEETWVDMKETSLNKADEHEDPIAYISGLFNGISIEIDDSTPYNTVEVMERWQWEILREGRKVDKENDEDEE